jgi:hypothetical protein
MATKKQRKTRKSNAKKKKRNLRLFFLSLILMLAVGFLAFFFISLFDYVYPPTTGKEVAGRERGKQKVQLYFADSNERFLTPETRHIPKRNSINGMAGELVKALIEGPKTGLVRTFPEGVKLQSVKVTKNGTAYVSFSKDLITFHPGGSTSEITTIYSLTNTLSINIPKIKRVKLLIDKKESKTIKGHIDTRHPFTLNRELLSQN